MGTNNTNWESLLTELNRRREVAYKAGGEERKKREHKLGRLTARERINKLADSGSFIEIGTLVTTPTDDGSELASTFICGVCQINGRYVAVGAEDFTVEGGGVGVHLRRYKGGWGGFIEEFAIGYKIPLVLLINGVGGSVILQNEIGYPDLQSSNSTYPTFDLLEEVPVLTAVLGPTAGSSAARAHLSHFSVMTKDNGCLFAGGPPVVKQALGLEIDKFSLGGYEVHTKHSGLINNVADTEEDALESLKLVLDYLPDNKYVRPLVKSDWHEEDQNKIFDIVSPNPRKSYDAQALVRCIADTDSFFEIAPNYASSVRTGFMRISGYSVGVIASDNRYIAGSLDAKSSLKQAKFVSICDTFKLPIVYLVDVPGFLVGPDAERSGTLVYGALALKTIQQANVPVYTVQVRRSYGLGGIATGNANETSIRLAWPSATWGDMPLEGGVEAAFKSELESVPASERASLKKELEEKYQAQTSMWKAVENFSAEEAIDPRQTRQYLDMLIRLYYQMPANK